MESYEYRYHTILADHQMMNRLIEERAEARRKEYNRQKVYEWRQRNLEHFREYQRNKANETYHRKKTEKLEQQEEKVTEV